jgi:hypothetical protein
MSRSRTAASTSERYPRRAWRREVTEVDTAVGRGRGREGNEGRGREGAVGWERRRQGDGAGGAGGETGSELEAEAEAEVEGSVEEEEDEGGGREEAEGSGMVDMAGLLRRGTADVAAGELTSGCRKRYGAAVVDPRAPVGVYGELEDGKQLQLLQFCLYQSEKEEEEEERGMRWM